MANCFRASDVRAAPKHYRRVHVRRLQRRKGRGRGVSGELYVSTTALLRVVFRTSVNPQTLADTTYSTWANQVKQGQQREATSQEVQALRRTAIQRGNYVLHIQRQIASAVERSALLQQADSKSVSFLGLPKPTKGEKSKPLAFHAHSTADLQLDAAVFSDRVPCHVPRSRNAHFNLAMPMDAAARGMGRWLRPLSLPPRPRPLAPRRLCCALIISAAGLQSRALAQIPRLRRNLLRLAFI